MGQEAGCDDEEAAQPFQRSKIHEGAQPQIRRPSRRLHCHVEIRQLSRRREVGEGVRGGEGGSGFTHRVPVFAGAGFLFGVYLGACADTEPQKNQKSEKT